MGIFDNAFAPFSGLGGVLGDYGIPGQYPQGNFIGGRSALGDIIERLKAGAARGLGSADFGTDNGIAPSFNYQPQQMPQSPADLALGVNRPQYAPTLPPPANVAAAPPAPPGVPQTATPQLDQATLPPNATP